MCRMSRYVEVSGPCCNIGSCRTLDSSSVNTKWGKQNVVPNTSQVVT